jgi:hypothetical protein
VAINGLIGDMMATVFYLPRKPGLGDILTQGIQGIQQGLQHQAATQQKKQLISALEQFGFSPEQSASYSALPDSVLNTLIQDKLRAPQQESYFNLANQLLGFPTAPQQVQGGQIQQNLAEQLQGLSSSQGEQTEPNLVEQLQGLSPSPQPSVERGLSFPTAAQQQMPRLNEKQLTNLVKLNQNQQKIEQKARHHTEQFEEKKQSQINKMTQPFYTQVVKKATAAHENNKRLDRMKKLVESGKTGSPAFNSLVKTITKGLFGFGIDLNYLKSLNAQELEKLSIDLSKNAKEYYGGNVAVKELELLMQSLPSIYQSPEAALRVINNMKNMNQENIEEARILKDVIQKNKGKRPENLELAVYEEMAPIREQLALDFANLPFIGKSKPGEVAQFVGDIGKGASATLRGARSASGGIGGILGDLLGGFVYPPEQPVPPSLGTRLRRAKRKILG